MSAADPSSAGGSPPLLAFEHRFIPARNGGSAAPVLLLLHGTGGDENSLLPLGRALAPDAALLSPRGQVLEHGATPRFFRRLAEGVFDVPDLIARAAQLAGFIRAAAAQYHFDARRVYALGYSNGANIAAALLLLHPKTLAGAALLRAMVPLEPPSLPSLSGVQVLMASGRHDPLVPGSEPEHLARMLHDAGATVTLRWQENAGHNLADDELAAVGEWLRPLMR